MISVIKTSLEFSPVEISLFLNIKEKTCLKRNGKKKLGRFEQRVTYQHFDLMLLRLFRG